MAKERLFLDTAYVQARLNRRDKYHDAASQLAPRVRAADVVVTEAVLLEIGNALSGIDRPAADAFIRDSYTAQNIEVVRLETALLMRGLDLYAARADKFWSLVDCISFVVMEERGLTLAATSDSHFVQAGFQALLL